MFRIGMCLLLASCGLPVMAQQTASVAPVVVTYFACVTNTTGEIYLVGKTTSCKAGEHKISWNQVGPPGPQGPRGPQGPQGPPGISVGFSSRNNTNTTVTGFPGTLIAQTAPVSAGTYYLSASTALVIGSGDYGFCYIATSNTSYGNVGGSTVSGWQQASNTDVISVSAGDSFQLWCYNDGAVSSTSSQYSTLTATLINSPSAAKSKNSQHTRSNHMAPPPK